MTDSNSRGKRCLIPIAALLWLAAAGCTQKGAPAPETARVDATATAGEAFKPVPLPDPHIPGYAFPEPEQTIIGWTQTNNQKAINLHAWGIWTALNQETDEVFSGQKLRVFETWLDPEDLQAMGGPNPTALQSLRRLPRRLKPPRQFSHEGRKPLLTAAGPHGQNTVLAFVKYDPPAADHITNNGLLSTQKLTTLLNTDHKTDVPPFPFPSVSLKPVFQTLASNQLVGGRYFLLPVWPGPPPLKLDPTDKLYHSSPFPSSDWGQCVWIDIQQTGKGPGTGGVDKTCAQDGSSRTDASTYGVAEFVNFRLTAAEAAFENQQGQQLTPPSTAVAKAGDYAVLTAMHVTSREITRWTWQTFWWTQIPDTPAAPSSTAIAADRPAQLTGAPRNYAHCTAYNEVFPPQPNSGGQNKGESVYCYNPYLEAPFGPSDLPDSQPGMTKLNGKQVKTANNVGAQTNCMSCHEQANFNPNNVKPAPDYTGDRYIDLTGPAFKGVLKVDFLWSLPDNAK